MNCLCNFLNDDIVWILIVILILLFICNNGCCGAGVQNDCGCGCR